MKLERIFAMQIRGTVFVHMGTSKHWFGADYITESP